MQPVTGITSHNARVAHIRKFVMVPPARGRMLRLVTCEEPPSVIGEWERSQCEDNGSTAIDVDSLLRDHAQTIQQDTTANLCWQDEQNQIVVSKRLKCPFEVENVDPAFAAQAEALGITGTERGGNMHLQTINERLVRTFMTGIHGNQQLLLGNNATLMQHLQHERAENRKLQAELDALRAKQRGEIDRLWSDLQDATDGSPPTDPEKEARAEVLHDLGAQFAKVLPHLMVYAVQKMSGAQPQKPPAAQVVDAESEG